MSRFPTARDPDFIGQTSADGVGFAVGGLQDAIAFDFEKADGGEEGADCEFQGPEAEPEAEAGE